MLASAALIVAGWPLAAVPLLILLVLTPPAVQIAGHFWRIRRHARRRGTLWGIARPLLAIGGLVAGLGLVAIGDRHGDGFVWAGALLLADPRSPPSASGRGTVRCAGRWWRRFAIAGMAMRSPPSPGCRRRRSRRIRSCATTWRSRERSWASGIAPRSSCRRSSPTFRASVRRSDPRAGAMGSRRRARAHRRRSRRARPSRRPRPDHRARAVAARAGPLDEAKASVERAIALEPNGGTAPAVAAMIALAAATSRRRARGSRRRSATHRATSTCSSRARRSRCASTRRPRARRCAPRSRRRT